MNGSKLAINFCILILSYTASFAQTIKTISFPELRPLPDVNVALDAKNIGKTDSFGSFNTKVKGIELTLSYLGYITQIVPKPQRDTTILMLPSSILLDEVVISPPKEKIIGYFGKWGNGVIYGKPEFNSSIVNTISISEPTKLKSFLFYIPNFPDSQINVPFEFVIFKEVDGKYLTTTAFIPIQIDQYSFLWNNFSLSPYNITLEPGNYLFGMKWIKSAINKENIAIRQALGTINKGKTDVSSYRSTPNKGWQLLSSTTNGITNFSIALLGLTIDK